MKTVLSVILFFAFVFTVKSLRSQVPYQTSRYPISKDSAVLVGSSTNYCNNNFDIKVNIYKPVGDNNPYRPLAIFAHGGGFTSAEDFNEYQMTIMAQEFAKRGYVTATMDYREGHHLYPYGPGSPYPMGLGIFLNWTGNTFVFDNSEVIRSIYRAQQDMKAVIRFMKKRAVTDSSDPCKTFIGGHSAGAITTLTTAFIDNNAEKPTSAGPLANAPNPQWQNTFLQINGPQGRDDAAYRMHNPGTFNFNAPSCYTRPDLGDANGSLHLDGNVNANILGLMALAGGTTDTNNLSIPGNPAVFLYHCQADLVVPFQSGRPFDYQNNLLAPPPNSNWPVIYGSNWVNNKLNQISYPTAKKFWVYDNGGNPFTAHDILPSPWIVADSVARFFASFMDTCNKCTAQDTVFDFTAVKSGNTAQLNWKTILYTRTNYFVVERSADNIRFDSLARVPFVTNQFNYQLIDQNPILRGSYYRIKSVHRNGQIRYSQVRYIQFIKTDRLKLSPVPVAASTQLLIPADILGKACSLVIYDMSGKKILTRQFASISAVETLDLSALQRGRYLLYLTGQNFKESISFTR